MFDIYLGYLAQERGHVYSWCRIYQFYHFKEGTFKFIHNEILEYITMKSLLEYIYNEMATRIHFGYLSLLHSTEESSILLINTTKCFIPAVFANIACSLVWPPLSNPVSNSPFLAEITWEKTFNRNDWYREYAEKDFTFHCFKLIQNPSYQDADISLCGSSYHVTNKAPMARGVQKGETLVRCLKITSPNFHSLT